MKLTERQEAVLSEMCKIGRENLYRYRESSPYLFEQDCKKVVAGDEYCVFGLGSLSYQVGHRLSLSAPAVLSVFKALERKGLVRRETSYPDHQRPRYWWPVTFASQLAAELQ
jgi:hypothetical protein